MEGDKAISGEPVVGRRKNSERNAAISVETDQIPDFS